MDAQQLGQQLRAAREARELTLDEVEQATRIRVKFLAAFEEGIYEDLPSGPQSRGFLTNYAQFLKLDEEAVLAQYEIVLASAKTLRRWRRRSPTTQQAPAIIIDDPADLNGNGMESSLIEDGPGPGRRVLVLLVFAISALLLVGVCAGGVWLVERIIIGEAETGGVNFMDVLPTVPSVTPSSTFVPSSTPLPGQQQIALGPVITNRVVMDIDVVQRAWMQVTVDGEVEFQGLIAPGMALQYQAEQTLNLSVSNGAALDVVFNNIPLGILGPRGQAVEREFTPDLALTPMVEPSPQPSPTFPPVVAMTVTQAATLPALDSAPATTLAVSATLPTSLPSGEQVTSTPPATMTATPSPVVPTETRTPTFTVTPSPTRTPTPTPILPPRLTSTLIPEKQE